MKPKAKASEPVYVAEHIGLILTHQRSPKTDISCRRMPSSLNSQNASKSQVSLVTLTKCDVRKRSPPRYMYVRDAKQSNLHVSQSEKAQPALGNVPDDIGKHVQNIHVKGILELVRCIH